MFKTGNSGDIFHSGIVQKNENNSVHVLITSQSACSGCHAEGTCTISGQEQKLIEISGSYNVKKGDEVTVQLSRTSGYEAVLLAYVIPLLIILISLIILNIMEISELMAGLLSIVMIIPYFAILFVFRNRVNHRFIFTLNN